MSNEDTGLIEYVLGILDRDTTKKLERELETDSRLQTELIEVQSALNSVADGEETMHPSPQLRNRVLRSVDPTTRFQGFVPRLAHLFDLGNDRIQKILVQADTAPAEPWVFSGIPGVYFLHFDGGPRVASADCGLVHLEPGAVFPAHRHGGDEWSFILHGRQLEDDVSIFEPGDIVHKAPGSQHAFQPLGNEPLVFAVALHSGFELVEELRNEE